MFIVRNSHSKPKPSWWHMPAIIALRHRQEDGELQASLENTENPVTITKERKRDGGGAQKQKTCVHNVSRPILGARGWGAKGTSVTLFPPPTAPSKSQMGISLASPQYTHPWE